MSINLVIKADAPLGPYECELVEIQPEAVPFMLYGIFHKLQKYYWSSHSDWIEGRRLMAMEGSNLLMPCGQAIVDAIDRQYTLLDVVLRGNVRSVTGTGTSVDPFVYDPVIPQSAEEMVPTLGSLQHVAQDTYDAWGNLLDGITDGRWSDDRNFRQLLQDLIEAAGSAGSLDDEILEKLAEIALLLA
jgi:hypothetical protein